MIQAENKDMFTFQLIVISFDWLILIRSVFYVIPRCFIVAIGIASLHLDTDVVDMHLGAPHVSCINKDYLKPLNLKC